MNLNIDAVEDRNPIYCHIDNSPVINITGEGGSGKTTYSQEYRNNPDYIVVDYDVLILGEGLETDIEFYLRKQIEEKFGKSIFESKNLDEARKNFTIIYEEIINLLQKSGKKIVMDGTQLRFINDVKKIRGELIVLRPSIETCVARSIERKQLEHPELSSDELQRYGVRRRETLYKLNPLLNELINKVAEFTYFEELTIRNSKRVIQL